MTVRLDFTSLQWRRVALVILGVIAGCVAAWSLLMNTLAIGIFSECWTHGSWSWFVGDCTRGMTVPLFVAVALLISSFMGAQRMGFARQFVRVVPALILLLTAGALLGGWILNWLQGA